MPTGLIVSPLPFGKAKPTTDFLLSARNLLQGGLLQAVQDLR